MTGNRLRILFDNQLIGLQMTANPAALTNPLNVLTEQRSRVFRSHQNADSDGRIVQQILINSPSRAFVADSFAISQHNLSGADSIQLELFDGENQTGTRTYGEPAQQAAVIIPMPVWHPVINYWGETYSPAGLDRITPTWFDEVTWRSARITIVSHSNPAGYIDVGMMMLGRSFSPKRNFSWGSEMIAQPDIKLVRSQGGSLLTERGMAGHREMSLDLEWMDDDDRNQLSTQSNQHAGKALLVSAYPDDTDMTRRTEYTMMAKKVPGSGWIHTSDGQWKHLSRFLEI